MNSGIILKTPFIILNFNDIETFVLTIFPDLKLYIKEQTSKGIQKSDLKSKIYYELEKQFRLFIVRNYSKNLDEFIYKEAKHADKEAMKEMLLSTISITLNVTDNDGHKLNKNDYLIPLGNIIKKIK